MKWHGPPGSTPEILRKRAANQKRWAEHAKGKGLDTFEHFKERIEHEAAEANKLACAERETNTAVVEGNRDRSDNGLKQVTKLFMLHSVVIVC